MLIANYRLSRTRLPGFFCITSHQIKRQMRSLKGSTSGNRFFITSAEHGFEQQWGMEIP